MGARDRSLQVSRGAALGTGTGTLLPGLEAAAPEARLIGVDLAIGMLREARAREESALLAAMDLTQLGIRESAVDAALLAFVLFLLPNPLAALSEVRRCSAPAGSWVVPLGGGDTSCQVQQSGPGSWMLTARGQTSSLRPSSKTASWTLSTSSGACSSAPA